jgi:hypothetical protein
MRTRLVTALAAVVLLLTACEPDVSGTVQDKRTSPGKLGATIRELCIGNTKDSCTWHRLHGKYARARFNRCDVGEQYPACRRP